MTATYSLQAASRPPTAIVRSVQFSCQLLSRREGEFIERFYESMVAVLPQVRELTPPEGRPLCDGLVRSVLWSALTQDDLDAVEEALRRVGAGNRRQGFVDDWYKSFGKALLYAASEMHHIGWESRLSSDWGAYYTRLRENLLAGAATARPQDTAGPAPEAVAPRIESLAEVLTVLRARYFPDDQRSLAAVCTRVALRIGADLRNPRPDQYADPAVISNVLNVLLVLGYSIWSFLPDLSACDQQADDSVPAPAAGSRWSVSRFFGKAGR